MWLTICWGKNILVDNVKTKLLKLLPRLAGKRVLVIGDLMVDKFIWGKVRRISPEAPVPVVEISRESYSFGGAANVANNIRTLDGEVAIVGVVGTDMVGEHLLSDLEAQRIDISGVEKDSERPTIIKTRIIAQHQQVVRVDREDTSIPTRPVLDKILDNFTRKLPEVDAVIISDYGKGTINSYILPAIIEMTRKQNIPLTVDPKVENFLKYRRVTCITPNLAEAAGGMRMPEPKDEEELKSLGKKILQRLQSDSVLITRGENGMTLFEKSGRIVSIPTRAQEVFDVTGAGDTVIAVFTLALAAKIKMELAAEIANYAAGIVVGKLGTATVTPAELSQAIQRIKRI